MKKLLILLLFMLHGALTASVAQQRRPIDSQHPLWLVHIDVWNNADPQKIIDLIPEDIRPYVCMNLSLSCQYDKETAMYRMPRNAVRTYKSWATVCQLNGMWFTCQPASGGHTHIQDNDLDTFEYFFRTFPNFLGWNYAEQFWGYGEAGDLSSATTSSRWELFANLVEMSHKYGGFLTVSWCGGIYHFYTDPIAELKQNSRFLEACRKYPEAMLFLYKYTHCSSFYNNESCCFGPFISGLTKNYGVRYDNCGWNDMLSKLLGDNNGKKYPGAAGIGTVMEQTCVNGGAVWDGPELIWREECFQEVNSSTVDGYTRRNWGQFPNFKGIWIDMWRKILDGTMYIPTREEVVAKTKAVLIHDSNYDFQVPDDLYDGLYKVSDPGNRGNGNWEDNLWYLKSTGRYGAIPMVTGLYDAAAQAIPVQVKKSQYSSRWGNQNTKVNEFNNLYPQVSTGDLYVNRYRNQLVTYTPYTYFNTKKSASAEIPLKYNTCQTLSLTYAKLSSGVIREYADRIDFYLNNYRADTTTVQSDIITITGVTSTPSVSVTKHSTGATGQSASVTQSYNASSQTYTVTVSHLGPVDVSVYCTGSATNRQTDVLPNSKLETPQQPEAYTGPITIEAENMDRKSANCRLTSSAWWAPDYKDFAGIGFIETQANSNCALRHQLKLATAGRYNIRMRYCNSNKAGTMRFTVNSTSSDAAIEQTAINDWREATVTANLVAGTNTLIIQNTSAIQMTIDQVTYEPVGTTPEKFLVTVKDAEFGSVTADVSQATAGQTVKLTITPDEGYSIKELRVVNSVFFTQGLTIPVTKNTRTVSFTMRDEDMVIQPMFYDTGAFYNLDFTNVAAGELPVGWRTTDGTDVRNYPTSNGSGPRTFAGLTGYQGKALYWRNTSTEYGRLSDYPLTLKPGKYELVFAMAAWKEAPKYMASILTASGSTVARLDGLTATPNLNGNSAGNISSAVRNSLKFEVTETGNYVIEFRSTGGGYTEFMLAECKVRLLESYNNIPDYVADGQPLDVTHVIENPSFDDDDSEGWQGDEPGFDAESKANNARFLGTSFDFYQELSGLPNGRYLLKVKGFHRPGGHDDAYADYKQGTNNASALVYANTTSKLLPHIAEGAQDVLPQGCDDWTAVTYNGQTQYVPRNQNQIRIFFNLGLYETELPVIVTDGTLRIGIKLDNSVYGHMVAFDDFRLYFLQSLGDVNGNGGIDIGDAVSIVNHLVGKSAETFIEKAADTNKNNQIDIGDAVTIVNLLVGKTTTLSRSTGIWREEQEPQ